MISIVVNCFVFRQVYRQQSSKMFSVTLCVCYRVSQGLHTSAATDQDWTRHLQPQDDAQGPLRQPPRPGLGVLDRGQEEAKTLPGQTQGQRREGEVQVELKSFKSVYGGGEEALWSFRSICSCEVLECSHSWHRNPLVFIYNVTRSPDL